MTLPYHTPLPADILAAHGVPDDWTFGLANRVQFYELDALNHVNNAVYLRWFESFRLPYLNAYGVSDYGPTAPRLVLRSVSARFHREMGLGQDYIITGRTTRFRNTSFTMEYACWSDGLCATGDAVIVLMTQDGADRVPLTDAQKQTFKDRDGATQE
ncbi:acyl-CoA thioesterase [Aliiroseovarius sp. YM-037]|uniref:acyl-CoA thioesterase n=1 Tax=Aliiroseovarius sp. YM-037 TaxID=3341728 RepID=UPI003A7FC60F